MVARPALEPAGSAITEPVIEPAMKLRAERVATHGLMHVQLTRELVHVQLLRERQPADGPPLARTLARRARQNRRNRRLARSRRRAAAPSAEERQEQERQEQEQERLERVADLKRGGQGRSVREDAVARTTSFLEVTKSG